MGWHSESRNLSLYAVKSHEHLGKRITRTPHSRYRHPKENRGFNFDTNELYIINPKRDVLYIVLTSKREITASLLDKVRGHG